MKKHEEAIQTTVYNTEKQDEELPQSYDPAQLDDGFKPSFLYVERGPGAGQLVQIKQGPLVCGRASVSDLRLQHSSISRRHAQLTRAGERFYIKDLGSQNGTFVNKIKIATEIEIYPGDQLALGNAVIKLRGPLQQAQAPASAKGALKSRPGQGKVLNASNKKKSTISMGKVAIFAGAVGFGLAGALMFAVFQVQSTDPSAEATPVAQPEVRPPAGASLAARERASLVEARLREAMKEQQQAQEEKEHSPPPVEETIAAPEPESPRAAAVIAAAYAKKTKRASVARPVGVRSSAAAEKEEEEEEVEEPSTPASGPKRAAILARYEEGNVAASIEAARAAGDRDLTTKLTRFQTEYQSAGAAMAAKNGTAAIRHFDAALKLDEQLSSGWSRYGTEIRKQLSGLWTLVGFAHLEGENDSGARQAFTAALRHDPENRKAKAELAKLGTGEKAAAKGDIDDAFGDEEKPARTPVKTAPIDRASAIDDAFGD